MQNPHTRMYLITRGAIRKFENRVYGYHLSLSAWPRECARTDVSLRRCSISVLLTILYITRAFGFFSFHRASFVDPSPAPPFPIPSTGSDFSPQSLKSADNISSCGKKRDVQHNPAFTFLPRRHYNLALISRSGFAKNVTGEREGELRLFRLPETIYGY